MITPLFSISQTARHLHLKIRAPHSRPQDLDLRTESHDFHFYSSPYLLHLRFEHPVLLSQTSPTYDIDTGIALITLDKTPPYPNFTRLDMLSTLLVTRPTERRPPSIEVVNTTTTTSQVTEHAVQSLQTTTAIGLHVPLRELSIGRPTYGFGARYEAVFCTRAEDMSEVVELQQPDVTPVWRRKSLRKAAEDAKFCPQHYMADYLLAHEFEQVLQYESNPPDVTKALKEDWVDIMIKLPKREYLREVDQDAMSDLAGVLFAAAYDLRITLGERCVESAWTISRICASMAFLEQFKTVREAILAAYRRSLAYPLYRHLGLARLVLQDVKRLVDTEAEILRARLLRVLLEVRELFEQDRGLRLHSDLFLTDYCIWIQSVEINVLEKLKREVLDVQIEQGELEWDLNGLEERAKRIEKGEEEIDDVKQEKVGQDKVGESREVPQSEVTISALSPFPSPALEMKPVVTRKLISEVKVGNGTDSSSYEYTSYDTSSSSSCSS